MKKNSNTRKFIHTTIKGFLNESSSIDKLILYHGTKNKFDTFDLNFFNTGSSDGGWLGYGIYLTNDYEYAESYGDVLECEVILKNPYILTDYKYSTSPQKLNNELETFNSRKTTTKLKELGYDSTMLKYSNELTTYLDEFIEVCIFNPSNIKIVNRYEHGDSSTEINIKRGYLK